MENNENEKVMSEPKGKKHKKLMKGEEKRRKQKQNDQQISHKKEVPIRSPSLAKLEVSFHLTISCPRKSRQVSIMSNKKRVFFRHLFK